MNRMVFPIILLVSSVAFAAPCSSNEFGQIEESKNISQLIRSNTATYWTAVKDKSYVGDLANYEKYTGIVSGDPHLGNFTVTLVEKENGKKELSYLNVDFDDAGVAPFAYDFTRLVIAIKAIDPSIKTKEVLASYIDGLKGRNAPDAREVASALKVGVAGYEQLQFATVMKKTSGNRFQLKQGEIEPYVAPYPQSQIEALFPGRKVLDLAIRPRERGGSANSLRIWVLVESTDRKGSEIFELKEFGEPAVAKFTPQPLIQSRIEQLYRAFWPELSSSTYKLVELGGDKFWLREKAVTLIDAPSEAKSKSEEEMVRRLGAVAAHYLGASHGRQASASEYLKAIEADEERFKDAVSDLAKRFLDEAKEALK